MVSLYSTIKMLHGPINIKISLLPNKYFVLHQIPNLFRIFLNNNYLNNTMIYTDKLINVYLE